MRIIIKKADLPKSAHGAAATDDQNYYIVINENDTAAKQEETLIHEVLHIWRGDLDRKGENAGQLDRIRHEEDEQRRRNCKTGNIQYLN